MPQISVPYIQGIGYEGMIGDTNPRVIRGALEKSIAMERIPYGRVVCMDVASGKLRLPNAVTDKPLGIAIATDMYSLPDAAYIGGGSGTVILPTANSKPADSGGVVTAPAPTTDYPIGGEPAYPPNSIVNYLTWGDIMVWVEEAVNAGDAPLFRAIAVAAPKDRKGRFAKTAVPAELVAYANARFLTATTAAGLVWLSVGGS